MLRLFGSRLMNVSSGRCLAKEAHQLLMPHHNQADIVKIKVMVVMTPGVTVASSF